jgi:hypothetical protein
MIQKIKNNVNGTAHIIIQKNHGEIFCFLGNCATLVEKKYLFEEQRWNFDPV